MNFVGNKWHSFDHLDSKIGNCIEDFEIGGFLGDGGFAKVYEARCLKSGFENFRVAIKKIDKDRVKNSSSFQKRVDQEIRIHSKVKHPSIVKFYTSFQDDHYIYLVLELCKNGSLQDYYEQRKRNAFSEEYARQIIKPVIEGVIYLHSKNVVHRDLTLRNLLLTEDMQIKIADFGLSTELTERDNAKYTMLGTPNYMPPEIVKRTPHSFPADCWSLGCSLYALLVGKLPIESAGNVQKTLTNVIYKEIDIPEHLSYDAQDLLRAMLRKNPEERIKINAILNHPFFKKYETPEVYSPKVSIHNAQHQKYYPEKYSNNVLDSSGYSSNLTNSKMSKKSGYIESGIGSLATVSSATRGKSDYSGRGVIGLDTIPSSGYSYNGNEYGEYMDHYQEQTYGKCSKSSPILLKNRNVEELKKKVPTLPSRNHEFLYKTPSETKIPPSYSRRQRSVSEERTKVSHRDKYFLNTATLPKEMENMYSHNRHFIETNSDALRNQNELQSPRSYKVYEYENDSNNLSHKKSQSCLLEHNSHENCYECNYVPDQVLRRELHHVQNREIASERHKPHPSPSRCSHDNLCLHCSHADKCVCYKTTDKTFDTLHDTHSKKLDEMRSEEPQTQNHNSSMNKYCPNCNHLVLELQTTRLKSRRHESKNIIYSILANGSVALEYFKMKQGKKYITDVFRISKDGIIYPYKPEGKKCIASDKPPPIPIGNKNFCHKCLPVTYWKKYEKAIKFISILRALTEKITLYGQKAKCIMMENSPDPDFKITFYDGGEITISSKLIIITEKNGRKFNFASRDDMTNLSGNCKEMWNEFVKMEEACKIIEELLESKDPKIRLLTSYADNSGGCFPLIVGRKPQHASQVLKDSNKENISSRFEMTHHSQGISYAVSDMTYSPSEMSSQKNIKNYQLNRTKDKRCLQIEYETLKKIKEIKKKLARPPIKDDNGKIHISYCDGIKIESTKTVSEIFDLRTNERFAAKNYPELPYYIKEKLPDLKYINVYFDLFHNELWEDDIN